MAEVLIALVAGFVLLCPGRAMAAPRFEWQTHTLKESDKSWKLSLAIYLSKPPDTALMPVRFVFTPVVYYERSLLDGHNEPVTRKIPLQDKQAKVENMDLGFLDPATGKIESRTKFSFSVTRDRGFEAGEYDVVIRDGRTDQVLGTKAHFIFEGDNDVVDRRAMVFNDKKQEKPEPSVKKEEKAYSGSAYSPDDPAYWEGGPKEPAKKEEPLPPPASMKERPGACGCRLVGDAQPAMGLQLVSVIALSVLLTRRRR